MTTTLRYRGTLVRFATLSLALFAVLALAIGLNVGGVGIVIGLAIAALLVGLIVGIRRHAFIIDGSRIGFRNGLTGSVKRWLDAGDVALTTANYRAGGGRGAGVPVIIYWERAAAGSKLMNWYARLSVGPNDRDALDRLLADGSLRPFYVSIGMLGSEAIEPLERFSPPRRG